MKLIKRFSFIFFAIVLLFSLVPFQSFAVDPVSASVIANAFGQAIASYGAANGVSMTFDVSSTDGIGESVHELWKRFREGQQTADDYATIAQAIFPELYYKTSTAIATTADAVAVGVHISSEYAEELDNFYNWLLSGPAEMVQVDNQYYQFSQAQIGDNAQSITVLNFGTWADGPLPNCPPGATASDFASLYSRSIGSLGSNQYIVGGITSNSADLYPFCVVSSGTADQYYVVSHNNGVTVSVRRATLSTTNSSVSNDHTYNLTAFTNGNSYYQVFTAASTSPSCPVFSSFGSALSSFTSFVNGDLPVDHIGVQSYTNTGIADFPDTADPNYDALNRAKDIPLNIPWDDAIYGDGSGTLTDAESAAIAGDLTQALETDRTVELVEEQDIPIQPDYSDVLLPLIPINIPSFNFSLSGIWHYVRSWVTSLGAWLSMMFSVWGILPYAIVVPVYACLVIVIVLGLYKRFFM